MPDCAGGASGTIASRRSSRSCGLLVHVRDLDPVDRPGLRADRERRAGIVGVHVHLERARVADDEQRVAELLELALERFAVEALALDHEDGAVADTRDSSWWIASWLRCSIDSAAPRESARRPRPTRRRARARGGRRRRRRRRRRPSAPASCSGVRASASSPRRTRSSEQLADRRRAGRARLGLLRQLADHRQHRPLDGAAHGAVGRVARAAERTRGRVASIIGSSVSPSTSATPRTIWEKMTPELPRAPISAPRATSRASECRLAAVVWSTRVGDRAHRQRQVRAGVAVGNGIDVQVVDARAVRLERRERRVDELSTASRSPFRPVIRSSARRRCAPRPRRRTGP